MANNNASLNVRITATIKGLVKKLDDAEKKLLRSSRKMSDIGQRMGVSLSLPIVAAGTAALKTAAEFETLQNSLNILTGSTEDGAKAFERLKKFSAKTPFKLQELTKVNNIMMGFGMSSDQAFDSLSQLGNIAAIMGSDFSRLAINFGQVSANGYALTRDLREFVNNGLPIWGLLEKSTGRSIGQLQEMATEQEITFDMIVNSLKMATEAGGQFYRGLEKGSQTLQGVYSTFMDNVSIALAAIGDEIANTLDLRQLAKDATDFLGNLTQAFKDLSTPMKKFLVFGATAIAALSPLFIVLGGVKSGIAAVASVIKIALIPAMKLMGITMNQIPIIAMTAALVALGVAIYRSFREMNKAERIAAKFDKRANRVAAKAIAPLSKEVRGLRIELEQANDKCEGFEEIQTKIAASLPNHISNVSGLKAEYESLKGALDEATASIEKMGKIQGVQSLIKDINDDLDALSIDKIKFELDFGVTPERMVAIRKQIVETGTSISDYANELTALGIQEQKRFNVSRKTSSIANELISQEQLLNDELKKRLGLFKDLAGFDYAKLEEETYNKKMLQLTQELTKAQENLAKATTVKDKRATASRALSIVNQQLKLMKANGKAATKELLDLKAKYEKLTRTDPKVSSKESDFAKLIREYREEQAKLKREFDFNRELDQGLISAEEYNKALRDLAMTFRRELVREFPNAKKQIEAVNKELLALRGNPKSLSLIGSALPNLDIPNRAIEETAKNLKEIAAVKLDQVIFGLGKMVEQSKYLDVAMSKVYRIFEDSETGLASISKGVVNGLASINDFFGDLAEKKKELAESLKVGDITQGQFDKAMQDLDKFSSKLIVVMEAAAMVIAGVFDAISSGFSNQLEELDNRKERELKAIDQLQISEEARQQHKAALEEKFAKKSAEIKRRQAIAEKAAAIASAIMNTAVAVTAALLNPVLAAIIGSLGAAQVGVIAAQPIPQFANGGIVSGRTLAEVGEYGSASRGNPEVIAPLDKLKSLLGDTQGGMVTGEFRLRGDDLVVAVEQANRRSARFSGRTQF